MKRTYKVSFELIFDVLERPGDEDKAALSALLSAHRETLEAELAVLSLNCIVGYVSVVQAITTTVREEVEAGDL